MARSGPALALLLVLTTAALAKYEELEGWRGGGEWSEAGGSARLRLAALEAEDERHDAELLAAVTASVRQWQLRRARTRSKRSQGSVCYGEFGCFEDAGPFAYLETLPSPPQEVGTQFLLYSTLSRGDQPLLSVPASNMSAAWAWAARAFDSEKSTRVIVHGFGSNCDNVWVYEMRSALMAVEECNVICVDWEGGAVMPNYLRAAANTRLVGKQLAMLLTGLSKNINLRFQDVHLIGFSLGAHVAGFAGSELGNISRITGLDPAGPLFEFQDPRARLDSNDAKFVDVIHSNGDSLLVGGLGAAQPLGHVDFYPNGGRVQHGCSNLFLGAVSDLVLPWSAPTPEGRSLCNHRRAYKFFTDSVSPKCHFPAFPCSNYDQFLEGKCFPCGGERRCGNMGYYADRSLGRGQLYLLTREEDPFCAHQYQVTVVGSDGAQTQAASASYGRVTLTLHGDSGLNETFPITKKEDTALPRGGRLSRMIVPHPALGAPLRATLHYAAYSGWLSTGAKTLAIEKLLIADSFGNMSSYCKRMELVSNEPVDIPLRPGDCQLPKEATTVGNTTNTKLAKITEDKTQTSTTVDPLENELPNDIRSFQSIFEAADLLELGKTSVGDGRAFGLTNIKKVAGGGSEIAEPILRPRPHKTPRNRVDDTHREISEPILRATQPPPSRKPKNIESEKTTTSTYDLMPHSDFPVEETGFAVQFLPTRLASFISRAERYARDTLLPLVSAYAPRLPIFGAREVHKPIARYIPTEPDNSTAPIPTPTLEAKIEALKTVGPPKIIDDIPVDVEPAMMDSSDGQFVRREDSKRGDVKEGRRDYSDKVRESRIGVSTTTENSSKVYRGEKQAVGADFKNTDFKSGAIELNEKEVLKPEPVSTSTSTALPPVAVKSPNGEERLLIVYPSNARDERKIRSHSYPEVLQFEALYRHTASPDLHVDLPTYRPPSTSPLTTTANAVSSPSDKFIPVTQSSDNKFIPVVFKEDGTTIAPKL